MTTDILPLNCPRCGKVNADDWPLDIEGKIVEGGCQDCWEAEADAGWWRMVLAIAKLLEPDPTPERWRK